MLAYTISLRQVRQPDNADRLRYAVKDGCSFSRFLAARLVIVFKDNHVAPGECLDRHIFF
jgi:hypothetical protein